jgi:hypothetical protein
LIADDQQYCRAGYDQDPDRGEELEIVGVGRRGEQRVSIPW